VAAKGPPPTIIWLTCGNTSNTRLREVLTPRLARAPQLIEQGDSLVEISDA
jgi:predicted nuclease of predicted toxin-antitoxin system